MKDKILNKEVQVKFVNYELKSLFPEVKGDKVIQIGTTFWRYGDEKPIYNNNMITLKNTDQLPNIDVYSYQTERQVLMEWAHMIKVYDPDIVRYNIFGFDETFLNNRALELLAKGNLKNPDYLKFLNLRRLKEKTYKNKEFSRKINEKKLALFVP